MTLQELKTHAEALPWVEREELADCLWQSLDAPPHDEEFDRELARRLAEYDAGRDPGATREEAMAELRRGLS